ncbi:MULTISPECIES: bifunctional UDP-N-acetylglucosamine diphosphorylase/glucosamine-1-phosphate N-acetyltransferase GlmU [unclassified Methylophilus]|jgi:bifunctional UDP-N-acetylglucosamine pyrophosphorylase / glucosamine-1-phosphate N-acetyltransferase|uniref:Bifunctional protein GlmU n=1 Tax=Methylophilus glucosoxydans TaxID=752553 RepID=A0ABW3GJG6_9PROT|nr:MULTISPECIES: bifunctional UDP-N-acetylglucosamine diphosphorylase/glucosamine-1-phosphate N-acetyltransferase GlmU [unclassified Methylophilus]MDF0379054.1 UDP-N-acetylglucosamine diphosphorylase/glucosamine-1-phosphate N-acetyltransferase [Methylophilus sp. YYY-1]MDT7848617.1 bifunctional UDP-N-acetylglucosamine diphosphorylase/glucosamine-1-phosphate N-acetyltransferase GlmU [Methylophilus sp. VKM B-3414]BEV09485.1 bifunctional UDP-N-acetylglucosamine diphosphorylase/glucosamine-1-phosphat
MTDLNIVILAAGKGTRMRSDLPKVLHAIGGTPILHHVINAARKLNPQKIIVVYGFGGEQVQQQTPGEDLVWVLQAEQLGTGHAVQQALPHLPAQGKTLILLGDVPLVDVEACRDMLSQADAHLVVQTFIKDDPTGYGRIVRNAQNQVVAIVEHKDASEAQRALQEVNTGIMAMPNAALKHWLAQLQNNNAQQEYYLTDIIAMSVNEGRAVLPHVVADAWSVTGINSKLDLQQMEREYQHRQALNLMTQGVTLMDAQRIDIRGHLNCGRDVRIDVNCVFEGEVTLEDGVDVGPNCVIKNAVIARNTTLAAFTHIEEARVGQDSKVGPFARLRPGTHLAAETHVGNFVELKNASVGLGSKVNHLSYVGDATVGANVNIGAGTITCNYDGANKHQTVIEDDVFVGSDSQLVAPVTIGKGATIAAGSTITKDVPAETLTLCRAREQRSIQGWKRPQKVKK